MKEMKLKETQLDELRTQLTKFVSGAVEACPLPEQQTGVGAKCGGHSSHTDNDGWV